MNSTSFFEMIEAYLDGDLDAASTDLFESELSHNGDLQQQLELAVTLKSRLASLPRYRLPQRVVQEIESQTQSRMPKFMIGFAVAASVLIAILIVPRMFINNDSNPAQLAGPTEIEMIEARQQLGIALAYLDRAGDVMGREVGTIWFDQGIARPVNTGLKQSTERMSSNLGAGESG